MKKSKFLKAKRPFITALEVAIYSFSIIASSLLGLGIGGVTGLWIGGLLGFGIGFLADGAISLSPLQKNKK